jgi:YD repeat-containing protein
VRVVSPEGDVTTYAYDALGRRYSATDGLHNSTDAAFDAADRLVRSVDRDGRVATYAYDALAG